MNQQLRNVIEQLNKQEINYMLDSGTLLGLIREGGCFRSTMTWIVKPFTANWKKR